MRIVAVENASRILHFRNGNPNVAGSLFMTRATKSQWSQNFSAFSKVYETSTNQISRS